MALPPPQAPTPSPGQAPHPSSLWSVSSGILEEVSPRSAEMPDWMAELLERGSILRSNISIHGDFCFL